MQAVKLGILHTNDTHSYLDLFGQRAHLIKGLRAQYQASLLLGAGISLWVALTSSFLLVKRKLPS